MTHQVHSASSEEEPLQHAKQKADLMQDRAETRGCFNAGLLNVYYLICYNLMEHKSA